MIEFDEDSKKQNRINADVVVKRLRKYNIKCAKWTSGNKSVHVHCMVDTKGAKNIQLLKITFMRFFGIVYKDAKGKYYYDKEDIQGKEVKQVVPDLRLAASNHLIRAEYGIHEKTEQYKHLISKDKQYPCISRIPTIVWDKYRQAVEIVMKRRLTSDLNKLDTLPGFKFILQSERFRISNDGRERALFMLIHVLKPKYVEKRDELINFLQQWYRYSGGTKLSDIDIERKVIYHWKREYKFGLNYLNNLLTEIGREDLIAE